MRVYESSANVSGQTVEENLQRQQKLMPVVACSKLSAIIYGR
jgi:hypothetical protein